MPEMANHKAPKIATTIQKAEVHALPQSGLKAKRVTLGDHCDHMRSDPGTARGRADSDSESDMYLNARIGFSCLD